MESSPRLKITALTFDLGNVLVKVDHLRFCRRLGALAGQSPRAVFAQVFESSLEPGYDTGRLTTREFHRRLMNHFGVALPYPDFAELWCDIFDPMEAMPALVERLAARFPLFLLSNTNALHFDYIRARFADLLRPFQDFVLSYEAGSRKPEAAIYQTLIRAVGRPPGEILFLDDKEPFVDAARQQGLEAWQFRSPETLRHDLKRHQLW